LGEDYFNKKEKIIPLEEIKDKVIPGFIKLI